jgi:hypothetical protein
MASTQGFESGDWVLVQPGEAGTSRPWELVQVEAAGEQSLELSRALVSIPRTIDEQVRLVEVSREPEGSDVLGLDRPRQGAAVPGGTLPVEGQAPRGSQVLVFIDGVEGARLEADASGRFEGAVTMPLAPGRHQVQLVSGLEDAWILSPEPVTFVSLAPPPTPVVLEPSNGGYTNDSTPLFRGTAQAGVTVIVAIEGTDVGSTTVDAAGNWSLSPTNPLAEGGYFAAVRARSSSGETSGSASLGFTVDLTPPNTTVIAQPAARATSKSARIRFTQSDFGVVECSLDGGAFQACFSPYDIANLTEGAHVVVVRATDRAGNVDPTPSRVEWIVDTIPPTTQILTGPPTRSNRQESAFTLSASEEVGSYECTLDGTALPASQCGATTSVSNLSEGPHVLKVRAIDLAGLAGPEATYPWTTDYTPPARPVLLRPAAAALLNSPTPELSGTAEPGSEVRIFANGTQIGSASVDASGNWTTLPSSGLKTDTYQLTLEVWDAAGNVNREFSPTSFRVDVDKPDTFIASPDTFAREASEYATQEASPRFAFRSNEEEVSYECSVGEEPFGPCDVLTSGSRSFEPGRYTLRVRARDAAGNEDDTPVTRTWVYTPYLGSGGGLTGCSAAGASPFPLLVPLLALLKRRRARSSQRETVRCGGLLALLVVLLAGAARAQGLDLQQYKPAPGSEDVLGVYSPQVARHLGLSAGLSVSYARNPLVLRNVSDEGFAQSIVSDQLTVDVLASISLFNHFELGLALPITGQWGPAPGNLAVFIPENATGTGVGDLRLVPKAVLPVSGGLSLGLAAVLSLPTAGGQSFRGNGVVGVQPTLLVQWARNDQLKLLANVGGRFQPDRQVALLDLRVGNELTYAVGAHWAPAGSGLFVQASVEGASALNGQKTGSLPLELLAAVGYSLPGGMAVRVGGGPGLTSGYGTPNFRLFASFTWESQPSVGQGAEAPSKNDGQAVDAK